MIVEKRYKIESELGVLTTTGHKLTIGVQTLYDSTEEFFEKTGPREAFKSDQLRELMLQIATMTSVRNGTLLLNRMRRADRGMIDTTFRNCVEREGESIQRHMDDKAEAAIEEKGLAVGCNGVVTWKETDDKVDKVDFMSSSAHIDAQIVHEAAKSLKLEEGSYNPSDYERDAVNISSDEVGVKRQTESRPREEGKGQPKRVESTVIHIETENESGDPKIASRSSYVLNSSSVTAAHKLLLGFLCLNDLLGKTIVFFVDGARNLNTAVTSMFCFLNVKIILDWYHLRKKMEERTSMICNNRFYRNELLQKLMPVLWRGDVDSAIAILEAIDMSKVKSKEDLEYLIGYLGRVRDNIPNYMLRAALGLRNSSNCGEKANDLIVSKRQKHNGMSWSDSGSVALASVSAVLHNSEFDSWIKNKTLSFQLVERTSPKRSRRNRKRTGTAYENKTAKVKKTETANAA